MKQNSSLIHICGVKSVLGKAYPFKGTVIMSKALNAIGTFFANIWNFLKSNRKFSIPAGVVVLLVLAFVLTRGRGKTQTTYQTQPLARGELTATIGATGSVRAAQSAVLLWQTTGTVNQVNVKVGDNVNQGDVLATLAQDSLSQNIILGQADLVSAQKALDDLLSSDTSRANAWITLQKAQTTYKTALEDATALNGPITYEAVVIVHVGPASIPEMRTYRSIPDASDIATADANLALAKAQLEDAQRAYDRVQGGPNSGDLAAAQARVNAAQATLNTARIIAPFAGTVTQAQPLPGDQVTIGAQAVRVDG